MQAPDDAEGFTLVELLISLALFALIATAGVALVDGLLGVENRTDGRLTRLADIQRTLFVIDNDLSQITAGPIEGQAGRLSFDRPVAAAGGLPVRVSYALAGSTLARSLANGAGSSASRQSLLGGIASLRWSFYAPGLGWTNRWPPSPPLASRRPAAVAVDFVLAPGKGVAGTLRRVVALPVQP